MSERINEVASLLQEKAYEAEFAGKERGRFVIDRVQLKQLLGVPRLHSSTLAMLADECLNVGLVLIDMDDRIGFAEAAYVEKWRKLPDRLVNEYTSELNAAEVYEDDDETED